jgi:peptidoglycan/xylan/chitin deacetylase (PgdA/CDA1 family)
VAQEDAYDPALHMPPASLLPPAPDFTRGNLERMTLSITFDGGYEADDASTILDALRLKGIRTTVFLTGVFIKRHPEMVRRIVTDGHEVGNHTMNHPHLTDYAASFRHTPLAGVDREMLSRELKAAAALFKETSGAEMAPLWRAPYGEVNADIRQWAFDEGYVHVGWTYDFKAREGLDTLDWVSDRSSRLYRTSGEIKERILRFGDGGSGARGGIILMHLGTGRAEDRAADVLGEILDGLIERGYRFVKVTEMLDGSPALEVVEMRRKERIMRSMVSLDPQ